MVKDRVRSGGKALKGVGKSALKKAEKETGLKTAAKHAAKKAPAKAAKHAGKDKKKHGGKKGSALEKAFHHLQRAATVISLVERESGSDLRILLQRGIARYEDAAKAERKGK